MQGASPFIPLPREVEYPAACHAITPFFFSTHYRIWNWNHLAPLP
jgi:hypothetical protein